MKFDIFNYAKICSVNSLNKLVYHTDKPVVFECTGNKANSLLMAIFFNFFLLLRDIGCHGDVLHKVTDIIIL